MEVPETDILEKLLKAETALWDAGLLLRHVRQDIERLRNIANEARLEAINYKLLSKRGHGS